MLGEADRPTQPPEKLHPDTWQSQMADDIIIAESRINVDEQIFLVCWSNPFVSLFRMCAFVNFDAQLSAIC